MLRRAESVPGTNVIRADLISHHGGAGFSSGGYSEIRNALFMQPGMKEARWLLPDDEHVIVRSVDVTTTVEESRQVRITATAALVKPRGGTTENSAGRLLLLDSGTRTVVQVADGLRELHVATVSDDVVALLYEREQRLVLASFDPASLTKRNEEELSVPSLK